MRLSSQFSGILHCMIPVNPHFSQDGEVIVQGFVFTEVFWGSGITVGIAGFRELSVDSI